MTATSPATLLVLNAGSSSLKFAVYAALEHAEPRLLWRGQYAGLGRGQAQWQVKPAPTPPHTSPPPGDASRSQGRSQNAGPHPPEDNSTDSDPFVSHLHSERPACGRLARDALEPSMGARRPPSMAPDGPETTLPQRATQRRAGSDGGVQKPTFAHGIGRRMDQSDSADLPASTPSEALTHLLDWLEQQADVPSPTLIGHRVVHGGATYTDAAHITPEVMANLHNLIPLAPLHQPHSLNLIHACTQALPAAQQIACFDTAFHHTQPMVERRLALPRHWHDAGVMRYGFHGLSYEYIADTLARYLNSRQTGRVIVAHLGQGASLAALRDGQSLATTMGFTALEGLPMGTRCGALDPGVVLYFLQEHGLSTEAISNLLYSQSGLLGLSGISGDMRVLLEQEQEDPAAREAIAVFVHRCVREIGALIALLGGLDHLVFTGGMGEHASPIRERICQHLTWLGLHLDPAANTQHQLHIQRDDSTSAVWVIPTDEELMIARHSLRLCNRQSSACPAR